MRLRRTGLVVLLATVGLAHAARGAEQGSKPREPTFSASVRPIGPALARTMRGVSWRPGCPVPLGDLRVIDASYWGFDGRVRTGRLIVHRDVTADVVTVLRRLFVKRFPIRRMVPIDRYGGDDYRSIEADNTSAFNCRPVTSGTGWSQHAYGRAIDLNPIENPYVDSAGRTSHRASRPYLRRTPVRPGMVVAGGAAVKAFDAVGWGWGGRWSTIKDYQHFSATGR